MVYLYLCSLFSSDIGNRSTSSSLLHKNTQNRSKTHHVLFLSAFVCFCFTWVSKFSVDIGRSCPVASNESCLPTYSAPVLLLKWAFQFSFLTLMMTLAWLLTVHGSARARGAEGTGVCRCVPPGFQWHAYLRRYCCHIFSISDLRASFQVVAESLPFGHRPGLHVILSDLSDEHGAAFLQRGAGEPCWELRAECCWVCSWLELC